MVTIRGSWLAALAAGLALAAACAGSSDTLDVEFPGDGVEEAEATLPDLPDVAPDGMTDLAPDALPETQDAEVAIDTIDEAETTDDADDAIDGSDGDVDPDAPESPFIDSPELFLKILGPASDHYAASAGSLMSVTGVMFGAADEIRWKGPSGEGTIEPSAFWLSDAITLEPGDNVIEVTAKRGESESTDRILVVYTPGFVFTQRPMARPDVAFVNESVTVIFTIRFGSSSALDTSAVGLYETLPDDSPGNALGLMKDDGQTGSSGDEIANDGVLSYKASVKCDEEGLLRYRVGVPVKTGVTTYTAYSPPVTVECVQHLTQADCQAVVDTQKAAATLYETKKKDAGEAAARKAVVDYLSASAMVKAAGAEKDGYGVWAQYKSGVLGVLPLAPAGLRASPGEDEEVGAVSSALVGVDEIASKKAVLFAPFATEFGSDDEMTAMGMSLKAKTCPTYDLAGPLLGPQSSLAQMRGAMGAGIVGISTHGDTFFTDLPAGAKDAYGWSHSGAQEALLLGEPVACGGLLGGAKTCSGPDTCPGGTECVVTSASGTYLSGVCVDRTQADLKRGRVAIGNGTYAVLPSFFERYGRAGMPDSLVYLGACRSAYNGTLAAALLGAGARAIAGYTGYVSSKFAGEKGRAFFQALVDEGKVTGAAFPPDTEDPDNAGSRFTLIGSTELTVTNAVIVNEGFERGDLTGWSSDGDGRVITKLGITKPVSGKFMGIISTGLGFTVQTGLIEQTFCIPAAIYGFSFYWKFYSEEFHEFCGSQYQDTFQARFVTPIGQELEVVNVAIDDLCDPNDCSGCCEAGKCVGLVPSDVQFDIGDTHVVPKWQKAKVDISQFAGKGPITLSFFATDKGDSIYDTVILIDSLKFQ
jgi:hypothetical protein